MPDSSLVDLIKYRGGDTDFNSPLKSAYKICKENIDKYSNIVLYFMSDGDAEYYPESEIQNFIQDQDLISKTKIYTVAFGINANKEILNRMAMEFPDNKGKMIDAPSPEALGNSFK